MEHLYNHTCSGHISDACHGEWWAISLLQHHNSSRRLEFSDDSSGAARNSVLGSSDEEEVDGGGEVSEGEELEKVESGRGEEVEPWVAGVYEGEYMHMYM